MEDCADQESIKAKSCHATHGEGVASCGGNKIKPWVVMM